ncbi:MAG: methylated-DNA--[protein]-cysteine S-methyltransferase [Actinobacteria bacterium]|nr:MAG: methylated-DNA--[protein]-cysteine S-methyltransferase [Actinomycetota bacterium]
MDVQVVRYDADGWGTGELWFDGGRLVNHELPHPGAGRLPPSSSSVSSPGARGSHASGQDRAEPAPKLGGAPERLAERLQAYFRGVAVEFTGVSLGLDWCTEFQRAVAEALRGVPRGETVTYGELAALAGHPNAQRAAGTFCAHNRFPILVPCHRVVAADGLGSYGSLGSDYKRRLLALEGVRA